MRRRSKWRYRDARGLAVMMALAWMSGNACADAQKSPGPSSRTGDGYQLMWHDEFDKDGPPDPSKWNYETGFVRNKEPQWYQPDNATVIGGTLVIEARRTSTTVGGQPSPAGTPAKYTSASLITKDRFAFRYGKVVIRARIDTRQGMWPAFWMLGIDRGPVKWPACGEVDIMEYYRGNLLGNLFWDGGMKDTRIPLRSLGDATWPGRFHIWQLSWDERQMTIDVDHRRVNTFDLTRTVNRDTGVNPFHQKMYLLINLALGQHGEPIPDQNLPAKVEVDYVRIYQRPDQR